MLLNFVSRVSIPFLLLVSVLGGSVSAEPIRLPKEGFRSNILCPSSQAENSVLSTADLCMQTKPGERTFF